MILHAAIAGMVKLGESEVSERALKTRHLRLGFTKVENLSRSKFDDT